MKRTILALAAVLVIAAGIGGAGAAVPTSPKLTKRAVVRVVQPGHTQLDAPCRPGERVTGGGFEAGIVGNEKIRVTASSPLQGLAGWSVDVVNETGTAQDLEVDAICTT